MEVCHSFLKWKPTTNRTLVFVVICTVSLLVAIVTAPNPRMRNMAVSKAADITQDKRAGDISSITFPTMMVDKEFAISTSPREPKSVPAITLSTTRKYNNEQLAAAAPDKNELTLATLESILDPADVVTTKLTKDGKIDWAYYDSMQLYHTRKAGGSSLFVWATKVAQKHNLTVNQQEGTTYDPHDWMGRKVFVFTSLRPPVDRVISSFEYDGLQTATGSSNGGNKNTTTLQNFFDCANDVNDGVNGGKNKRSIWRDGVMGGRNSNRKTRRKRKGRVKLTRGWIWRCATDCYSKWFGGWPKPETDTQTAVQRLDRLEIVWMNNYQNPHYMKWFLHRWDAEDIPMIHRRKTANRVKQNYTDAEMSLLHTSNWKDKLLYEALRKKWSRLTHIPLQ